MVFVNGDQFLILGFFFLFKKSKDLNSLYYIIIRYIAPLMSDFSPSSSPNAMIHYLAGQKDGKSFLLIFSFFLFFKKKKRKKKKEKNNLLFNGKTFFSGTQHIVFFLSHFFEIFFISKLIVFFPKKLNQDIHFKSSSFKMEL